MDTIFLDEFSQEVWSNTYKNHKDNSVDDTFHRLAKAIASVEKNESLKKEWEDKFYELLSGFKLCAGGRIIANAGTDWKGVTLMNCFVGPKPKYDQDSLEGIFAVLLAQAQTLKSEGGWGMNFSFIRPRGAFIHGIGVETPGSVKYMEIFNKSSDVITAGSGKKSKNKEAKGKIRKGAMMGVLDVWHPDIEEFISAKLTEGRLDKFNISVNCSDEFMDRVNHIDSLEKLIATELTFDHPSDDVIEKAQAHIDNLEKWNLIFPDTKFDKYKNEWDGNMALWKEKSYPYIVYKTVKVSELWEKIMKSTFTRNDPGVLFLDRANATHCWNYGGQQAHIAATNPCGEQCLPFGSVCNLASLNLTQFVLSDGTFDFDSLNKYTSWAVRFLDNINDLSTAPLTEYEVSIKSRRRIGLGVMGWGSALYMMKIRFGSDAAEILKDQIMFTLTHCAVDTSVLLAKEKGAFIGCDFLKHSEHPFFRQIGCTNFILDAMAKYGIRNSALFSIQPTGNTSILANVVSGGLEPIFLHEYIRTVIVNHCPPELIPLSPKYWEGEFKETSLFKFVKEGDESILRGEYNGIIYKIDKNRGLTKEVPCIDYGVRFLKQKNEWNPDADWAVTTTNLSVEEHVKDMKGFGKWIDSSMSKTVNLPNDYDYNKFKSLYLEAYKTGILKGITTYRDGTMTTVLSSSKPKNTLPKSESPKRPDSLQGELHHFQLGGHKYFVAVGLYGDNLEPYEVFTGINETRKEIYIPKSIKKGKITKLKRGNYSFFDEENDEYELTNGHSDDTAAALTRIISTSLRHGADISFIVHQLEKTEGSLQSFSKILARTLKKYIEDGTKISGEECPECKGHMVRKEGCATCSSCGYSKCV